MFSHQVAIHPAGHCPVSSPRFKVRISGNSPPICLRQCLPDVKSLTNPKRRVEKYQRGRWVISEPFFFRLSYITLGTGQAAKESNWWFGQSTANPSCSRCSYFRDSKVVRHILTTRTPWPVGQATLSYQSEGNPSCCPLQPPASCPTRASGAKTNQHLTAHQPLAQYF